MRDVKYVFWNAAERRMRAGWRLGIELVLFLTAVAILEFSRRSLAATRVAGLTTGLYLALGFAVAWVAAFIDRRRLVEYGFHLSRRWAIDFAFGFLAGAVMMSGIFLAEWVAGWIHVTPQAAPSPLAMALTVGRSLIMFFTVALVEEFTSRGYQIRNLAEGLAGRVGPRTAIALAWIISAAVFGFLHVRNPNATVMSSLNLMLSLGGVLGLGYVLTGELAIPIGIHLSWNFFQGTVFGFPVSGMVLLKGPLILEQSGPEMWTGGAFGPEAGLVTTVAAAVGCALVAIWIKFRDGRVAFETGVLRYVPCSSGQSDLSAPGNGGHEPASTLISP
jgi:uncharacterized protein